MNTTTTQQCPICSARPDASHRSNARSGMPATAPCPACRALLSPRSEQRDVPIRSSREAPRSARHNEVLRSAALGSSRESNARMPRLPRTTLPSAIASPLQEIMDDVLAHAGDEFKPSLLRRLQPAIGTSDPERRPPLRLLHPEVLRQPSPPVAVSPSLRGPENRAARRRVPSQRQRQRQAVMPMVTRERTGPVPRPLWIPMPLSPRAKSRSIESSSAEPRPMELLPELPSDVLRAEPPRPSARPVDFLPELPSDVLRLEPPRPSRRGPLTAPPRRRRSVPPPLPLRAITQVPSLAPPRPGDPRLEEMPRETQSPFEGVFLSGALPRHDTVHLLASGQLVNASDAPPRKDDEGQHLWESLSHLRHKAVDGWQKLSRSQNSARHVLAAGAAMAVAILLMAADGDQSQAADTAERFATAPDRVVYTPPVYIMTSVH